MSVVACVKQIVYIIVLYISGAKEGDVSCCLCQTDGSDKPNEIVLCDNCGLGMYIQWTLCNPPPSLFTVKFESPNFGVNILCFMF